MEDIKSVIQEFERANRTQLREIAKENAALVDAMKELLRFEPFKVYTEALNRMIGYRSEELMEPLAGFDAALRQEWVKGAMNGLILARDLPSITLAAMRDTIPGEDE